MMPGPEFDICGHRAPAYGVFVCTGLTLGTVLAMALFHATGRSPFLGLALMLPAIAACACLALATKIVTGSERLVFYHHLLAGVSTTVVIVWSIDQPLLPHLDVIACVGALVSAFGRIGCLFAGCCHGRPHPSGIRYTRAHASDGFPPQYVDVPLIPVQAIESLWAFAVTSACCAVVLSHAPAGAAVAAFALLQGGGRFVFEFLRGDARCPELRGLTEAQWTAAAMVVAALAFVAPAWLAAALPVLAVIAFLRWRYAESLFAPGHMFEALEAAARARRIDRPDWPQSTSRGIRITAGHIGSVAHYTLSSTGAPVPDRFAVRLSRLIQPAGAQPRVIAGPAGMFHIVLGER